MDLNTIIVRLLNGDILELDKFEMYDSLGYSNNSNKQLTENIINKVCSLQPWVRRHRARLIETESDSYLLVQNPPNVKKYITETNQRELAISIQDFPNSFYETNIDDLTDWLDGYDEKTYEKVVIEDTTSHYFVKLSNLICYQIGNQLPFVTMTKDYYKNYHQSSLVSLFSLISAKLKPSSIEWVGPIIPIDLFVDGFPLIKHLTLSYPIRQEDVNKLCGFVCLEEFSSPMPLSVMLNKETMNLKMNMVNYTYSRDGIQRGVVMGEFLF